MSLFAEPGIINMLPPLYRDRKGVLQMEMLLSFYIAVMAGVVCHCINKWLDSDR